MAILPAFWRIDEFVKAANGYAIANGQVFFCTQPANTVAFPPSPLAQLYADPFGLTPISQPLVADGYGFVSAYVAAGTYTMVVALSNVIQNVYADQSYGLSSQQVVFETNGVPNPNQSVLNIVGAGDVSVTLNALGQTVVESTGFVLPGTGNGPLVVTANAGVSTAPNGDILTVDGLGNAQDSGVLISSLAPKANAALTGTTTIALANVTELNTVLYADQFPGADVSIQINAAIAAVISAGGGTVDARGLGGVGHISKQINVGNSSHVPVSLLLPTSANWGVTISDGVSSAFLVYDACEVRADLDASGGTGCLISCQTSGTNLFALLSTYAPSAAYGTWHISGLGFFNTNGGTLGCAVCLAGFKDESLFENSFVCNPYGIGLLIGGSGANVGGGPLIVSNVWCNGTNGGTVNTVAQPLVIEGNSNSGGTVNAVRWFGGSVVEPGSAIPNIYINGGGGYYVGSVDFYGLYMESTVCPADTGTPLILIDHAGPTTIIGGQSGFSFSNSAYMVKMQNSANGLTIVGFENGHLQIVNNTVTGVNTIYSANGNVGYYNDSIQNHFGGLSLIGSIATYNNYTTYGSGIPAELNQVLTSGLTANYNSGSAYTLVTPAGINAGKCQWRISYSQAIILPATNSSTFPSLTLGWTDAAGVGRTKVLVATSATNTTAVESDGVVTVYTQGTTAITITSASYASSGAQAMEYVLAVTIEQL